MVMIWSWWFRPDSHVPQTELGLLFIYWNLVPRPTPSIVTLTSHLTPTRMTPTASGTWDSATGIEFQQEWLQLLGRDIKWEVRNKTGILLLFNPLPHLPWLLYSWGLTWVSAVPDRDPHWISPGLARCRGDSFHTPLLAKQFHLGSVFFFFAH